MKYISPDAEERACPFCGAVVLLDREQRAVHHEAPVCDQWDKLMSRTESHRSITIVHDRPRKGQA